MVRHQRPILRMLDFVFVCVCVCLAILNATRFFTPVAVRQFNMQNHVISATNDGRFGVTTIWLNANCQYLECGRLWFRCTVFAPFYSREAIQTIWHGVVMTKNEIRKLCRWQKRWRRKIQQPLALTFAPVSRKLLNLISIWYKISHIHAVQVNLGNDDNSSHFTL